MFSLIKLSVYYLFRSFIFLNKVFIITKNQKYFSIGSIQELIEISSNYKIMRENAG